MTSLRNNLLVAAALVFAAPAHALKVGDAAPAFDVQQQGGGRASLAGLAGQTIYLDFWASWCGPCRQSFPWMNDLQQKFAARGLHVLAINLDAKQADADGFLAQVPARFPVAFDPKGETPREYQLKGMPTSFLIGPDGKILMIHQSFHDSDRQALEESIAAALAVDGVKP